jgi:phosphomannomutase
MVKKHKADGGLIITSSHNDVMWNGICKSCFGFFSSLTLGLKFVESGLGLFISPDKCDALFKLADSGNWGYQKYTNLGSVTELSGGSDEHIEAVLKLPYINVESIKARKLKICLDSINGAGGPTMKKLLEILGCEVVPLNLEPTGLFAHKPEPIPENLGGLCDAVKQHKADLGVAVDPDVDRCVLIDETGKPLGEEYSLALAVQFYLQYVKKTNVVKNLSTTRAVDDVCKKFGVDCIATGVGEINVNFFHAFYCTPSPLIRLPKK